MSDTVKLIIEIPKTMYENVQNGTYCGTLYKELKNGIPLDKVTAEIEDEAYLGVNDRYCKGLHEALRIIDKHVGGEAE